MSMKRAADWYRKAALQGFPYAQINLGTMYRDGKGVEPSAEEARRWFTLAADKSEHAAALLAQLAAPAAQATKQPAGGHVEQGRSKPRRRRRQP